MKSFRRALQLTVIGLILLPISFMFCFMKWSDSNQSLFSSKSKYPCLTPTDKLEQMKLGNYYGSLGQYNCRDICKNVVSVPQEYVPLLKPIGNYTSLPTLGITGDDVRQSILPQLPGGSWAFKTEHEHQSNKCDTCPKEGVAIILAYKNQWKQLYFTLANLIPLLQRQHLCYRIFVIEQLESVTLNKAKLFNIGFMEAAERFHFKCVIFHDVDVAPINDLNSYACDEQTEQKAVHLGVGLDSRNSELKYRTLIGGVLKISNHHFVKANGYSNSYWGWGQGDDDFERRLTESNIEQIRGSADVARYMAVPDDQRPEIPIGNDISIPNSEPSVFAQDGLNSLNYEVVAVEEVPLFTRILVSVGSPPPSET